MRIKKIRFPAPTAPAALMLLSLAVFSRAAEVSPPQKTDNLTTLAEQAQILFEKGDFKALKNLAWQINDLDPKNPWGYAFLGRLALAEGKPRPALGFFRQADSRIAPNNTVALNCIEGIFDSLFLLEEYSDARHWLIDRLGKEPRSSAISERLLLAQIAMAAANGDIAPLKEALSSHKSSEGAIWLWERFMERLTWRLLTQGKSEQAVEISESFCRYMPSSSSAWHALAVSLWSLDRLEGGFAAFRKAEDLAPSHQGWSQRYMTAGAAAARINAEDLMIEYFQKAARLGDYSPLMMNNLAWSYYLKGDQTELALQLAENAVKIDPDNAPSLDTLARLQARAGQADKALANIDRAIALSLFDPYVEDMRCFRHSLIAAKREGQRQ